MIKKSKIILCFSILLCVFGFLYIFLKEIPNEMAINVRRNPLVADCYFNKVKSDECRGALRLFQKEEKIETYSVLLDVLLQHGFIIIPFFALVVLGSIYPVSRTFGNKIIIYELERIKYEKRINKIISKSYGRGILFLLPILILLGACFIYSGNFDSSRITDWPIFEIVPYKYFFAIYVYTIIFFILFYINIGLIVVRKNNNIIIIVLESLLLYLGIDLLLEVSISLISHYYYIDFFQGLSLLGPLLLSHVQNMYIAIFTPLILFSISLLVVKIMYSNKESFITDIEKVKGDNYDRN